jgi:thiamine-monophosphate kinase
VTESDFLERLRTLPLHPGAHGLADDCATLGEYTITTDTLVEGVHYLPTDPADSVAWKLLATNLSDLAAKGATPVGVLLNYPLRAGPDDATWDAGFLTGLADALTEFAARILGGDTVSMPAHAPRIISLTAIGRSRRVPLRTGARPGDSLWVTGTIGDAGAGLAIAQGMPGPPELLEAYRRPRPRIADGAALAPHVHAMMDVSDGLLIDAQRMAAASNLAVTIDLAAIPLSPAYRAFDGDRIAAATAGDDYQLLFAAPTHWSPPVAATRVGSFAQGAGLTLTDAGNPVSLPSRLGFQHAV